MDKEVLIKNYNTNIKFKSICIGLISRFGSLSNNQIKAYKGILDFRALNFNTNIDWDLQTIEETKEYFDWESIYRINGVVLNLDFFEKYKNQITFSSIYLNKNVDWSFQLLDTYSDKWNLDDLMMKPIMAHPRNIKKYTEYYNWDKFSSNPHLNLNEDLIEAYKENWNWKRLCSNKCLKLDKKSIEKYKDYICFNNLSRNPSMVPFILAYPNEYVWNWVAFAQNPDVVFGDKLKQFLIDKFKASYSHLNATEELKINFAKTRLLQAVINSYKFEKDIWFTERFKVYLPWKELIRKRAKILSTEEIEAHLSIEDFDKTIPYDVMQKCSEEFIFNNIESLLKFRFSLFRYGKVNQDFVKKYAVPNDYYQIGFNENFSWSLSFVLNHLDYFDSIYSISQNQKLYNTLFSNFEKNDLEQLLSSY